MVQPLVHFLLESPFMPLLPLGSTRKLQEIRGEERLPGGKETSKRNPVNGVKPSFIQL